MQEPVAIIGIGCRFPGASNPQQFWQLLRSGQSAIREVPPARWDINALYDPDPEQPGKMTSRWGGFIEQVDQFDWQAFHLLPREARAMDPQHRLLLEVTWEALEDAGLVFSEIAGSRTSVSVGIGWSDYLRLQTRDWSHLDGYAATGNANCFAANRISYAFDLKGPSISLDTGCTSSLSAVSLACQQLWTGEAELALAGGVNLLLSPDGTIMASKAGLLARDGRCKTLDAQADGFVNGEGAGMVVLKRLSQVKASDRVYALLCGIATNHNGHNEWIVATSQAAQEQLLRDAYARAGINPADVDYVELHGTGFLRGDAIEAHALGTVLGALPERTHPCAIGSVKTNLGHLGSAAGIASVIKVALALSHQEIPPTLNVQHINPAIRLQDWQLDVPLQTRVWPEKSTAALAGVSTLSLSGVNAHAVLAGPMTTPIEPREYTTGAESNWLLPLSAHTPAALHEYATRIRQLLHDENISQAHWRNMCYTASVHRTHHAHRLAIIAANPQQAIAALDDFLQVPASSNQASGRTAAHENREQWHLADTRHQGQPVTTRVLEALRTLYMQGETVNWAALYDETYQCVSLPTFPWQRERLWPDWLSVETISTAPQEQVHEPVARSSRKSEPAAPTMVSLEQSLTALWSEVLGLPEVGAHDSFFELGGHSLLAAQLITRVRNTLQIELSLNLLLEAPTPSACAARVQQGTETTSVTLVPPSPPALVAHPEERYLPFPTTDVQQAYWAGRNIAVHGQHFGNHGYIEVAAPGLDVSRFNQALRCLIERHEMLRAVMLPDGQQKILASVPTFEATIVDLRGKSEAETEVALQALRHELDHQLLPIERWPAFDIRLVLLDPQHSQIHLSIESLFIDAWSMHQLVQEFAQYYSDPNMQLPALDLSFRDYILAETALHKTPFYQRAEEYWTRRLSELPPAPELPLVQSSSGVVPHFVHRESRLGVEQWSRLKARAARARLTPSGVLMAAFAEILGAWSKSQCFSINLSIFQRQPLHPQVNQIVGDFTALIVLAIDNTLPDTFERRAQRIQEQLWRDLDHSAYNGVRVLRELARRQASMMQAIMPIVFSSLLIQDMANTGPVPWQETLYCVSQTPQVWLDHQVLESAGELIFHWQVIEAIFPPGMVDAMFAAYQCLLERLADEEQLWQTAIIPVLPPVQRDLYNQMNATDAVLEQDLLQSFFSRQVTQRPDQPAVITPQRSVSYREVYQGAVQLARHLRQQGVLPNQLVAVVMEKGWEQVVAVLGILYAGGAYLPIDPKLPTERLHYLLQHGRVAVALTQTQHTTGLQWPADLHVVCVNEVLLEDAGPVVELKPVQRPEDIAYVIYTSGSTGLPKGVVIDHRGAVNTVLDINQRFMVGPEDRVFALSALNFDLSVYDIFGTLAAGGTIVMPSDHALRDPAHWLDLLVRERVTVWNSVPALLQMLMDYSELRPEALRRSQLRLAMLSGDWIPLPLPEQMRQRVPGIEVISLGGATEASIWSIFYPIGEIDPSWKSIPYGRALLNQRFFVLNEQLEPSPVWVPGQLYIGGIGLAKGYWRDEEKTRASFFVHPRSGERLYRTGDLGRYLPDGNIEFLGREDFQVKVHGHRIELGEIETTLLAHSTVQAAVVTTVEAATRHEKRLVAYVVAQSEAANDQQTERVQMEDLPPDETLQPRAEDFTYAIEQNHATSQYRGYRFGLSSTREENGHRTLALTARSATDPATQEDYAARVSQRTFTRQPIAFDDFCRLLETLRTVELEGLPKYRYPSAGGIYPVQIYLAVRPGAIEGVAEGAYYYNPRSHQLVLLDERGRLNRKLHGEINQGIFDEAAFSLFFVGQMEAMQAIYGDAARDFALLEAGYMGQLLMMHASRYQIGLCPIGDLAFQTLRERFSLGEHHIYLHSMLGGSIDPVGRSAQAGTRGRHGGQDLAALLRAFLKQKLPDYMVPSNIVLLDALPLTANGKVDRKNLPVPEETAEHEEVQNAPSGEQHTELERTIIGVWQELLPGVSIGLDDDFFDLGGNSLMVVRSYTRLQKLLPVEISIETLFEHVTVRSLADFLRDEAQVSTANA